MWQVRTGCWSPPGGDWVGGTGRGLPPTIPPSHRAGPASWPSRPPARPPPAPPTAACWMRPPAACVPTQASWVRTAGIWAPTGVLPKMPLPGWADYSVLEVPAGTAVTPNYVDNASARVAPWCDCGASGNRREECEAFRGLFTRNRCLGEGPGRGGAHRSFPVSGWRELILAVRKLRLFAAAMQVHTVYAVYLPLKKSAPSYPQRPGHRPK